MVFNDATQWTFGQTRAYEHADDELRLYRDAATSDLEALLRWSQVKYLTPLRSGRNGDEP